METVETREREEWEHEKQRYRAAAKRPQQQQDGGAEGSHAPEEATAPRPHRPASRIQHTQVCSSTCDPRWDAELIFPLQITAVEDVLAGEQPGGHQGGGTHSGRFLRCA